MILENLEQLTFTNTTNKFNFPLIKKIAEGRSTNIKNFLLNQKLITGIGNIYASEILFDSLISPDRKTNSLSDAEIKRILNSTKKILNKAIQNCGTTFSDFQDSYGRIGSYGQYLKVYQRENQICIKCKKNTIIRAKHSQRSTYFCSYCQK